MNTYDALSRGINNFLQFYAGYLEGKQLRKEQEHQKELRNLILAAIQSHQTKPTYKVTPEGEVSLSLSPQETLTPYQERTLALKEKEQQQKQAMRAIYGLAEPTPEQLKGLPEKGWPTVEGGYVVPTEEAEWTEGYEPMTQKEIFEEEIAKPTRERIKQMGYQPKFEGLQPLKREKDILELATSSEAQKKRTKARLFKRWVQSVNPRMTDEVIQQFRLKYGTSAYPSGEPIRRILRKIRRTVDDFIKWVEQKYGRDFAMKLYPEAYIE